MFRSRRSTLVKRLWKSRQSQQNEAACADESVEEQEQEAKALAQSILKRLKEKQLDTLIQSVESKGGENTECVLLPKGERLGRRPPVEPHVLCCQIWRWPDLQGPYLLKRLPCCTTSADDPTSVCCNPYHWSRAIVPDQDTPPPPYKRAATERVFIKHKGSFEEVVSTETGGTPSALRISLDGSSTTGRPPAWCNIAYWELRQRVGRLFTVFNSHVNIFQELPHGDGLCLSLLQAAAGEAAPPPGDSVRRTREKIGLGVTLSREGDDVWVYNRSESPIFVSSPTLSSPSARTFAVVKVPSGHSIKIFEYGCERVLRDTVADDTDGPCDLNSFRISFAKGWGGTYSRQIITSCPCWVEVLLRTNR